MSNLATRTKQARNDLGLSQGRLAEIVGCKQQSIVQIEKGKVLKPGFIIELARALSVSPEWLTGSTDIRKELNNENATDSKSNVHDTTPPKFTADDLLENALDLVERAIQRHHTPLSPAMIAYLVKGICNLAISGNLESDETQTGAHLNKFQTTGRSK